MPIIPMTLSIHEAIVWLTSMPHVYVYNAISYTEYRNSCHPQLVEFVTIVLSIYSYYEAEG